MADYKISDSTLTNIANIIRKKESSQALIDPADFADRINLFGPLPEATASGAIAVIEDGADDVPTKSVKITIPANLDGKSSVSEVQTGRNLLPNKTYQRNANTLRLGTDTLDGRLSLKASTYTLSITSDVAIGTLVYTIGGTSTTISHTASGTRYYGSFTLSADTDDIFIHVYKSGGITAENVSDFMLELGSTAHSYEPYNPTTYSANLGRTIHGAEVDLVSGTGKNTGAIYTITSENVNELTRLDGHRFYIHNRNIHCITPSTDDADSLVCDKLKSETGGSIYDNRCFINASGAIRINTTSEYATNSDFLEDFGGSITFAFILDPSYYTDITFDGQEIPTRLGYNCFISEQGDTEVTYRRDINLALQSQSGTRMLQSIRLPESIQEIEEPEEQTQQTEEQEETR